MFWQRTRKPLQLLRLLRRHLLHLNIHQARHLQVQVQVQVKQAQVQQLHLNHQISKLKETGFFWSLFLCAKNKTFLNYLEISFGNNVQ